MKKQSAQSYFQKIIASIKQHPAYFSTELRILTIAVLSGVFLFICFSVILHPDGAVFSDHFTSEKGAITILSATLLSSAALLAYACLFASAMASLRQRVFFLILALGLTFLALDEVMRFHEQFGEYLDTFRNLRKIDHSLHIRSWNDSIIILYGLAVIPLLLYFLPTAAEIPFLPEYFLVSFTCYLCHTLIDAFFDPPRTASHIIEESFKVYTSTFLVLGLISALIFVVHYQQKQD